jgi:hypothetical protein
LLTVYFGDSGAWSMNAFRDMAWYLRQMGLRNGVYFMKGERIRAKTSQAFAKVDLGDRLGRCRFSLFATPELAEIGQRLNDCNVFAYSYLPNLRVATTAALVALLRLPNRLAVRLLQRAFRKVSTPVGGFVVVQVVGRSRGCRQMLTSRLIYDRHRDYWINGLVAATTARIVAEDDGVQKGVRFLAEAIEPGSFLAALRKAGVEQTDELAAVNERSKVQILQED